MIDRLQRFLGRGADRPMTRPPGLLYGFEDRPPWPITLGLALQMLALQAAFFVVPVAAAAQLTTDIAEIARFLGVSIATVALCQVLHGLTRGPVGAGYPVPATNTAAAFGFFVAGGAGAASFGGLGAALLLTGVLAVALTFVMHRLRALLPDEVAGVVVLLIGVAFAGLAVQKLAETALPGGAPRADAVAVLLGGVLVTACIGLLRRRIAVFAVLLGALAMLPVSLALGHARPDAVALLAAEPWFALPRPVLPRFDELQPGGFWSMLVTLVALKATTLGALVSLQRAADQRWSRPDVPPLRRGLLANAVSMMAAGLVGAYPPSPSNASVGLAIANGTLARRIVLAGAAMLLVLACCPKLSLLFVLIPPPVQAAMMFYVAGFIMSQGAQLLTTRLADRRRAIVVALGLSSGVAVAGAPPGLLADAPAIAAPVAAGALVAFLANLLTLPLVGRDARAAIAPGPEAGRLAAEWLDALAGRWALKPQTLRAADQALGEVIDLLAEQRVGEVRLAARQDEARFDLTLSWAGPALPEPARGGGVAALSGDDAARRGFSMWLVSRQAQELRQRATADGFELRLRFED